MLNSKVWKCNLFHWLGLQVLYRVLELLQPNQLSLAESLHYNEANSRLTVQPENIAGDLRAQGTSRLAHELNTQSLTHSRHSLMTQLTLINYK